MFNMLRVAISNLTTSFHYISIEKVYRYLKYLYKTFCITKIIYNFAPNAKK